MTQNIRGIARLALVAAASVMVTSPVLAQEKPVPTGCVTEKDVESIVLALAPEILASVNKSCVAALPTTALLRQSPSPLLSKYQAESDAAWPLALSAFLKVTGNASDPTLMALMQGEVGRKLLSATITEGMIEKIKPEDCGHINHIIELLEPLPARNVAGLVAVLVSVSEKKDGNSKFKICKPAGAK